VVLKSSLDPLSGDAVQLFALLCYPSDFITGGLQSIGATVVYSCIR
jgi:hypothetical protein